MTATSMSSKTFPVLLIGIVVLGLLFLTLRRDPVATAPEETPDVGAMETRPTAGSSILGPSGGTGSREIIRGAPPPRAISPSDPDSMFARPVSAAEELRQHNRVLTELDSKYLAEAVDGNWASGTEPKLGSFAQNPGLRASGIRAQDYVAQCRSTTCRVTARFATSSDAEDWSMMYSTLTGTAFKRTRSAVVRREDGSFEARIYGYR